MRPAAVRFLQFSFDTRGRQTWRSNDGRRHMWWAVRDAHAPLVRSGGSPANGGSRQVRPCCMENFCHRSPPLPFSLPQPRPPPLPFPDRRSALTPVGRALPTPPSTDTTACIRPWLPSTIARQPAALPIGASLSISTKVSQRVICPTRTEMTWAA
jgi:hypothetical protein